MTDKQIIIDGVDVSGCASYIDNGECISEIVYPDYCKACSNCTYKLEQKLKRKEQECEELKAKCKKYGEINEQETKDYAELKAEVKSKTEYIQEQRDIINQYSKEIEMYKKCQGKRASKREEELKAENEKLDTENKRLVAELVNPIFDSFEELDKLKQTLVEIKEIAITGLEGFCPKCSRKECEDNNCIETAIRDILQKISECEGNDENN